MSTIKTVVAVQFPSSLKDYNFFTDLEGLQKEDLVVVDTANGMALGRVSDLTPTNVNTATRWIVQKVDVEAFAAKMTKEKQKQELLREMKTRAQKNNDLLLYQQLAATDPEMAQLLTRYAALNGASSDQGALGQNSVGEAQK